jgi:hypothetical protein
MFQPLRVTIAILSAAATSATIFVAADLIGVLILQAEGDATVLMLEHIALLWPASFGIALVHAVALGFPAYLVLNQLKLTRWWISLIGGYAIGCLPYLVFAYPWKASAPELIEAHIIARLSWPHYVAMSAGLGLLGMAGGLVAWLTWYGLGRRQVRSGTPIETPR